MQGHLLSSVAADGHEGVARLCRVAGFGVDATDQVVASFGVASDGGDTTARRPRPFRQFLTRVTQFVLERARGARG